MNFIHHIEGVEITRRATATSVLLRLPNEHSVEMYLHAGTTGIHLFEEAFKTFEPTSYSNVTINVHGAVVTLDGDGTLEIDDNVGNSYVLFPQEYPR